MSKFLDKEIKVLDKGFVRLVDYFGSDNRIVQAARTSYGKGTKTVQEDEALIRYLFRHEHTSPFEMNEILLHCKMPIFVARQWVRHRTASINEISGRYSIMKDEFYVPNSWRKQSKDNKQGSEATDEIDNEFVNTIYDHSCKTAFYDYEKMLQIGVGKEMARMNLPLSTYTEFYWKIDLKNLLHFLKLRLDAHAQYEIRVYAKAIAEIVNDLFPITFQAFIDYQLNAMRFSKQELNCLYEMFKDKDVNMDSIIEKNISNKLEQKEFKNKFKSLIGM